MSKNQNTISISRLAAADLSAKQYYFVNLNSTGGVVLADAAGESCLGVLLNKPTSGQVAQVAIGGVTKVISSGVIAVNAMVATDANGKAKVAVAGAVKTDDTAAALDPTLGSYAIGIHVGRAAAADGDLIEVLLTHTGVIPSTAS
jgi:hypothetical protein